MVPGGLKLYSAAQSFRSCGTPDTQQQHVVESESRARNVFEDLFRGLDEPSPPSRPLLHPATGLPLTPPECDCPTFRPPHPRAPHRPAPPRSATLPAWSKSKFNPSYISNRDSKPPRPPVPPFSQSQSQKYHSPDTSPISYHSSTSSPLSSVSRSSSHRSSPHTATSRSSSPSSRLSVISTRSLYHVPTVQPSPHNSIAELHARQVNLSGVQSPIEAYAEVPTSAFMNAKYAVVGLVRKRSKSVAELELYQDEELEEPAPLQRTGSFARLGTLFARGDEQAKRRSSVCSVAGPQQQCMVDISRNF